MKRLLPALCVVSLYAMEEKTTQNSKPAVTSSITFAEEFEFSYDALKSKLTGYSKFLKDLDSIDIKVELALSKKQGKEAFLSEAAAKRPCIELSGVSITGKSKDGQVFPNTTSVKGSGKLDSAMLDAQTVKFTIYNPAEKKYSIPLPGSDEGSCLALLPNKRIIVGCKNGALHITDHEYKQFSSFSKIHSFPITTIASIEGNIFITRAQKDHKNECFIWHANETKPHARLEDMDFKNLYVKDGSIICSHGGEKGLLFDNDKLYNTLPATYLSSQYQSYLTYPKAFTFYVLSRLYFNQQAVPDMSNADLIPLLKKSKAFNEFEPAVITAFQKFLDGKEKELAEEKTKVEQAAKEKKK